MSTSTKPTTEPIDATGPDCTGHVPGDWRHARNVGIALGSREPQPFIIQAGVVWLALCQTESDARLLARATHAPHVCEHADCPGNVNARKLVAYHELQAALELCFARLKRKSETCNNSAWKVADQVAFEAAKDALANAPA